mmetsp:Transcript_20343/g.65038  ORF Transcript_20343/g.65038 Transcript_20343/m.65038 type:complete len:237 (+) Transcript_20343:359-1069(+)
MVGSVGEYPSYRVCALSTVTSISGLPATSTSSSDHVISDSACMGTTLAKPRLMAAICVSNSCSRRCSTSAQYWSLLLSVTRSAAPPGTSSTTVPSAAVVVNTSSPNASANSASEATPLPAGAGSWQSRTRLTSVAVIWSTPARSSSVGACPSMRRHTSDGKSKASPSSWRSDTPISMPTSRSMRSASGDACAGLGSHLSRFCPTSSRAFGHGSSSGSAGLCSSSHICSTASRYGPP